MDVPDTYIDSPQKSIKKTLTFHKFKIVETSIPPDYDGSRTQYLVVVGYRKVNPEELVVLQKQEEERQKAAFETAKKQYENLKKQFGE